MKHKRWQAVVMIAFAWVLWVKKSEIIISVSEIENSKKWSYEKIFNPKSYREKEKSAGAKFIEKWRYEESFKTEEVCRRTAIITAIDRETGLKKAMKSSPSIYKSVKREKKIRYIGNLGTVGARGLLTM